MRPTIRKSANLGEMIVAEFDKAAGFSPDPREVTRLATLAVSHLMWLRARRSLKPPILARLSPPTFLYGT